MISAGRTALLEVNTIDRPSGVTLRLPAETPETTGFTKFAVRVRKSGSTGTEKIGERPR
jgi:hypothetical protein